MGFQIIEQDGMVKNKMTITKKRQIEIKSIPAYSLSRSGTRKDGTIVQRFTNGSSIYFTNQEEYDFFRINRGLGKYKPRPYYIPTGYGRGRPKKGESRPKSISAEKQRKYMETRKKEDPSYRDELAAYQREWAKNNDQRYKEIKRNTRLRKKLRDTTAISDIKIY